MQDFEIQDEDIYLADNASLCMVISGSKYFSYLKINISLEIISIIYLVMQKLL